MFFLKFLLFFLVTVNCVPCNKILYTYDVLGCNLNLENGLSGTKVHNYQPYILNGSLNYANGFLNFNSLASAVDLTGDVDYLSLRFLKNGTLVDRNGQVNPTLYYYQLLNTFYPLTFEPFVGHVYIFNVSTTEYILVKTTILSVDDTSLNINWEIIGSSADKDYKCLSVRNWEEKEVKSTKDFFGVSVWLLTASIILTVSVVVLIPWVLSVELRLLKGKEYTQINY